MDTLTAQPVQHIEPRDDNGWLLVRRYGTGSSGTELGERPAFRAPWSGGAAAYFEADSFEAALEGFKRKRKPVLFHMDNRGEAGDLDCAHCGSILRGPAEGNLEIRPTNSSSWHYDPKTKTIVGGVHYECSWARIFDSILKLRVAARG